MDLCCGKQIFLKQENYLKGNVLLYMWQTIKMSALLNSGFISLIITSAFFWSSQTV